MGKVIVRAEREEDVQAIDVVNISAFECEREAKLVTALRSSDAFVPELSLVAEYHKRIVGHILFSRARLKCQEGLEKVILVLAPESVVPSQAHRGIGSLLIEEGLNIAKTEGFTAVVVAGGEPSFHAKFGFTPATAWGLECNLSIPNDLVMAVELQKNTLCAGKIIYPAAFADYIADTNCD